MKQEYKTPEKMRKASKAWIARKRAEMGEDAYQAMKREAAKKFRETMTTEEWAAYRKRKKRESQLRYVAKTGQWRSWSKARCLKYAQCRAKKNGLEFTITVADLDWPTHCPVLGFEMYYGEFDRQANKTRSPSLDRHDNSKGYIPGNVNVISYRANALKSNATPQELRWVAQYAEFGVF